MLKYVYILQYRDGLSNKILNVLVAVSKGMQAVKLSASKILLFLTGLTVQQP